MCVRIYLKNSSFDLEPIFLPPSILKLSWGQDDILFAPILKMKTYPIVLSLLCTGLLSAQEYSISGTVENTDNEPVSFANVQLLKVADTTLVNGTSSENNGSFQMDRVDAGTYFIRASYIENESALRKIEVDGDLVLETLRLNANAQALDEVVVTSRKPRLERKVDRLVFNIENTALSDNDIWGALKRTPSVIIVNDKLTVKGSGAVGILINGRKVNIPREDIINLLSGTSASDVEAIEVITNPPAKYGAENGILINIQKKKNLVAGYNGAIYNRYTQGILPRHTLGTDHYFKGNEAAFSVNYSFSHNRDVVKYTDVTNFIENDAIATTWTAEQENLRRRKSHKVSAFFDYDFNAKNRLSLSTITTYQPDIERLYDTETAVAGDTLSGFNTLNNSNEKQLNSSFYLDFVHELDKEGAEISFNSHYTFYDNERGQALNTIFLDLNGNPIDREDFTTDYDQRIDLYNAQLDYLTPMGESSSFETGLRYAGIDSESKVAQQGFDRDRPGIDPTEAGNFSYDESIFAAYMSYAANWDAWRFKSGLRAEYTETKGVLDVGSENIENDYVQLFPSASIQYTPNEKHDFNLYYYRRIERPRYEDISPFLIFQNNFTTVEGNPNLQPATRHYLAGGYTLDNSYTVELFYKTKKNGLGELIFQDNDLRLLRYISANLKRNTSYGIDLSLNKDFTGFWNCYVLGSFFNDKAVFENLGTEVEVENELFSWFVRTSNAFTFLEDKSLTADLSFVYTGPLLSENAKFDGFGALSLFFRKTLWNKKASISMGMEDIFNQGNEFNTRNYLDQNGTSLRRAENRLFVLGFRYKFGNTRIQDNYKSKNVDEQNRL
ncbi:MAG: outer membrane beta-barrel protein [Pricia sp.]